MDLSVVILNWNTRALLEKCLESLVCGQSEIALEVIVVDNASEDDSRQMVRDQFPQVKLLCNPRNLGFGAGNNVAIPEATGRYVMFLNSDTVVMAGALAQLVHYADANADIGILGPKLLNGDGSLQYSCRSYPNLATGIFRNTPIGRLFPNNRFNTDYLLKDYDHLTPRDVDWVSGAALMIRRSLLDRIGGFDEDFFMYCEDVDLCWRCNHTPYEVEGEKGRKGEGEQREEATSPTLNDQHLTPSPRTWRVSYYPDAIIYHLIGKSSDMAPTRMTYEFHRSQYLFYKKHYSKTMPFLLRLLIPIGIALRAIGQMVRFRARYWQRRLLGIGKGKRKK